ncbi:MAG: Na/Pi symporter [Proteobacteria bacterium]|nr:Na/Pi symporter [Pseudomonadota bacterium]MBU1686969.1 Na/Pi symporter [Pseudomonadota bacterium]
MNLTLIGNLVGGLGFFILGMRLMTEGLKYAAGRALTDILSRSTATPMRGILTGTAITSLVQSSSAVTVATIGFVNAGLMDISHAVTLIYGSNLGTTVTGWLVSLIGFQFHISTFALPAIGVGIFVKIFDHQGRRGALGDVLAGFGLFFVGIDILKGSFAGIESQINIAAFSDGGIGTTFIFIGIGFLLTLLMQSSSASIALILTAAAGGIISINEAAAVIIGANVGTTPTAIITALGATANAKRLAAAHVIFNLGTGLIAFCTLPLMIKGIELSADFFDPRHSTTTTLALFHTSFNVLGIILFVPLTRPLVRFLNSRFRTVEEDEAIPRYLDATSVTVPVLAVHALAMELKRIAAIAQRMAQGALSTDSVAGPRLQSDFTVIEKLVAATVEFCSRTQRSHIPAELDQQLPNAIRISSYYIDVAELAVDIAGLQSGIPALADSPSAELFMNYKKNAVQLLKESIAGQEKSCPESCTKDLEELQDSYRSLKGKLLRLASNGDMPVSHMVRYLDLIARIRRIAERSVKAALYTRDLKNLEQTFIPAGSDIPRPETPGKKLDKSL